ncbi:MAG: ABC transporter permease [Candidatus Dormibacteraeota bacterium]|uniref:ABC transporter permease n=2 Tax=Candidatus Nephthysia bennettiae TaxID=3127016 RepID=A0A934K679_9BACT|nr:ABC transporter permease [Candidatus Dormibacteraeota bacterium]MBJ7612422.1 ABC transporter permease [Candidatus Dormibacteraeota bacterium]
MLGGIGFPIILLLIFGYISKAVPGNVSNTGLTVIDLYIPTMIVISFISIATSLPSTLVRDREIGWLRRVSTTPLHPSRLLAAHLIFNLVFAVAAILIITLGGSFGFGATLHVRVLPFGISIVLAIAVIFSFSLVIVALAPSQAVGSAIAGVLFFVLLFLAGLWVQPAQIGEPWSTVMYYSPSGAAAKALLDSAFSGNLPWAAWGTMVVYTAVFGFIAIRYFRWE